MHGGVIYYYIFIVLIPKSVETLLVGVFHIQGIPLPYQKLNATSGPCPFHPSTFEPLPSPLPDNISMAIENVEKTFSNVIDPNTAVSAGNVTVSVNNCSC